MSRTCRHISESVQSKPATSRGLTRAWPPDMAPCDTPRVHDDRHAAKWRALVEAVARPVPPGLAELARKVETSAYSITDAEVAALDASDEEIYDAVLAAAVAAAALRLERGLAACG